MLYVGLGKRRSTFELHGRASGSAPASMSKVAIINAVEERACIGRIEYRRLAGLTRWEEPRTTDARLTGTTWPTTSQSKRCRTATRRCLTVDAARSSCVSISIQVATWSGCTAAIDGTPTSLHQARKSSTARL
jgi:hypothetical protein